MNTFLFILNELLRAIRPKSGGLLVAVILLIFAFLALFSSLFLFGSLPVEERNPFLSSGEVLAYLSPRLSPEAIQRAYLKIREWEEVRQINFLFVQEREAGRAGGIFRIQARSLSDIASLLQKLASITEIVQVDTLTTSYKRVLSLSTPVRIGLLAGLAVSAFASLIVARHGFQELLASFAKEIQLMRLSGTAERTIQLPIVALGVLCGLVASLLLVVIVYLVHSVAVSHPQALICAVPGLVESGRVLTVSLLSLFLGLAMGGLIGAVGASLTSSREFQPYV